MHSIKVINACKLCDKFLNMIWNLENTFFLKKKIRKDLKWVKWDKLFCFSIKKMTILIKLSKD